MPASSHSVFSPNLLPVRHDVSLDRAQLALVVYTVFSQLSAAVVRRKANDGVVYAIRAWFSTTLHCLQWYKLVLRTRLSTAAVQ